MPAVTAGGPITLSFDNTVNFREHVYTVRINPGDMNRSYNPTLLKDLKTGELKDFAKTDSFRPHFTTVALCNDQGEILMVAKVAHPVPVLVDTPLSVQVRMMFT